MKAAPTIAKDVKTAGTIGPAKAAKAIIPTAMPTIEMSGNPIMFANIDANVCSCHVMGSQ
jgi:hypothetical protein